MNVERLEALKIDLVVTRGTILAAIVMFAVTVIFIYAAVQAEAASACAGQVWRKGYSRWDLLEPAFGSAVMIPFLALLEWRWRAWVDAGRPERFDVYQAEDVFIIENPLLNVIVSSCPMLCFLFPSAFVMGVAVTHYQALLGDCTLLVMPS